MGRGLSQLQLDILGALACYEEVKPSTILDTLGREHTSANFVAISKALLRLRTRNLVTQGDGYRYAVTLDGEAVLRRKALVAKFKRERA